MTKNSDFDSHQLREDPDDRGQDDLLVSQDLDSDWFHCNDCERSFEENYEEENPLCPYCESTVTARIE